MNTKTEKPGIRKSAARKPTIEQPAVRKPNRKQPAVRKASRWKTVTVPTAVDGKTIGNAGIRAASCALAFCLMMTGTIAQAVPAYASERHHEAETGEITFFPHESNGSTDSTVTGHIKVELLSVEMPAGGLEFEVDTTAPFQVERPGEQIQSPGISIRNRSVVPVKLEISQVAEIKKEDVHFSEKFFVGEDQSFQLVDKISGVGAPGTAILVLGLAGKEYSETTFEQDAIVPGKQNIFLTDIPPEEDRTLQLYGKVAPDFYGAYQFTVRPTLKISAVQATQG